MCNKKGTSLLTFLVYLMLFSMVTLFICHVITFLIIPSTKSMRECQSLIALHIATDLFVRDIKTIKAQEGCWKVVAPHELVWSQNGQDRGWCFCNNRLERKEGAVTSIIAKEVVEANFSVEKDGDCTIGVEIALRPLSNKAKIVTCYVALDQGNINEE